MNFPLPDISRRKELQKDGQFTARIARRYREVFLYLQKEAAFLAGERVNLSDGRSHRRLETLLRDVEKQYNNARRVHITQTEAASGHAYTTAREISREDISRVLDRTGRPTISFGMIPTKAVELAVQAELSGIPIHNRLLETTRRNWFTIRARITQAIIRGDAPRKLENDLLHLYRGIRNQVHRTIRTESHRTMIRGQLDAYQEAREKHIEVGTKWISAGADGRTRDTHLKLHGTFSGKDGLFHIQGYSAPGPGQFGIAEEDINCRCRITGLITLD